MSDKEYIEFLESKLIFIGEGIGLVQSCLTEQGFIYPHESKLNNPYYWLDRMQDYYEDAKKPFINKRLER